MSGYLSSLLTNTTSRYASLRRTLLSDEADGDTEDDTHICRVLRAYYTEKSHSLPTWLPPDPKKVAAAPPAPSTSSYQSIWQTSSNTQQPAAVQNYSTSQSNSSRGALSDLWDPPTQGRVAAPSQPTSLRRQPGQRTGESLAPPLLQPQARPLPSQRAGSYQTRGGEASPPTSSGSGGSGGAATAQERLKARLYGSGRAGSPGGGGGGRWG